MAESFLRDLRQAHRVVAAYERRILDAMAFIGDKLGERDLVFQRWWPLYHSSTPDARNSSWTRRWVWDYLPLNCVSGWWMKGTSERGAGTLHVVVDHVFDTGLETWRSDGRAGEPEPLSFVNDADTVWRVRLLFNSPAAGPIDKKLWDQNWTEIFATISGLGNEGRYPKAESGMARFERAGLKASQMSVSVEGLATPADFTARFVTPMLEEVDAITR